MMYSTTHYHSYLSETEILEMSEVLRDMDQESLIYQMNAIKELIMYNSGCYVIHKNYMALIPTLKMLQIIKNQVDRKKRLEWSNSLVRKLLFLSGVLIPRKEGYSAFNCVRTSFLARELLKNLFGDELPQQAKLYFKKNDFFYEHFCV